MKYITLSILAAAVALTSVIAGPVKEEKKVIVIEDQESIFRDQEIQFDLFFVNTFRKPNHDADTYRIHTGAGGGFGVNFIFARYFGIGAENYLVANNKDAPYHLGGYGILRLPIDAINLAPYALFGGGGGLGKRAYGYGSMGGGLEYRFTPHIGTFADARWMCGTRAKGSNVRAGLRLSF